MKFGYNLLFSKFLFDFGRRGFYSLPGWAESLLRADDRDLLFIL